MKFFLTYFSTVFMFTTVTAFAFTGVKSIRDMLIAYGTQLVTKLNEIDLVRQKAIFSNELTASWIVGIQSKIEEKGYNVEELLKRVEKLKNNLDTYNKEYKIDLEKDLDKLYYRIKFYTFSFGVYSSLMILTAALDGTGFFNEEYFKFYLFSFFISLYLITSYFFFYKKFSDEVVKKYMKSFSIIIITYTLIMSGFYFLFLSYFIVQIILLCLSKFKLSFKSISLNLFLIFILYLGIYYLNTINLFIDINFIESYINDLDYKFWNYTFIVLFLSIYVVISLFIPAILFRNKAIHLRKKYGKKRDEVWEEFKGLMFVKDLYKEFKSEQEKIVKKFSS